MEKYLATLSEKEQFVLRLMARGKTKVAMAAELGVSVRAVENYRTQIMRKLNTSTQAGLWRFLINLEKVGVLGERLGSVRSWVLGVRFFIRSRVCHA